LLALDLKMSETLFITLIGAYDPFILTLPPRRAARSPRQSPHGWRRLYRRLVNIHPTRFSGCESSSIRRRRDAGPRCAASGYDTA
jgi:hypothetical protein